MRTRRQFRPLLHGALEDRVVLSHGVVASLAPLTLPPVLSGHISGSSHSFPPVANLPGSGYSVKLSGSGAVDGIKFQTTGSLSGNGTVAPPFNQESQGTLTLKNAHGSVTLALQGPALSVRQNGVSTTYNITVTGATGAYSAAASAGYTGTATLSFSGIKLTGKVPKAGLPGKFTIQLSASLVG